MKEFIHFIEINDLRQIEEGGLEGGGADNLLQAYRVSQIIVLNFKLFLTFLPSPLWLQGFKAYERDRTFTTKE